MKKIAYYNESLTDKQLETIKSLAQDAIVVQDACNLAGVVHSLWEVVKSLRTMGFTYGEVDHHPITKMFVHKVGSMTGVNTSDDDFSEAYKECKAITQFTR